MNLQMRQKKQRYNLLDGIRGITLLSMILYHAVWDLVYIFAQEWKWYRSDVGYVWQQSICWVFILLSGFCWSLGRRKWKRGLVIFAGGLLITAVTVLIMPKNRVVFGVLTLIGSCTFFMIPIERILRKCNCLVGICVSFCLFVIFRNINDGYLGFEGWNIVKLPEILYCNLVTTYLGFPKAGFYSTDYFSILPWIFLYVAGYFLYRFFEERSILKKLEVKGVRPIEWFGRHSFEIYMLHQPLLYVGLSLFFYWNN